MTTMIRRILFLLVGVCVSVPLAAQTMSVFSIDNTDYPTIHAKLIVANQQEQSIRTFSPGDFVITENGKPVSGINVYCPPVTQKGCVYAVMVIDQSLSMMELIPPANTVTRLEAVKAGAATFLQTIDFSNSTAVALTSFDAYAYVQHDFIGSRFPLESKVQGITPNDNLVGTNYGAALADPFAGALPLILQRNKSCPRVIVFLTDGFPVPDFYREKADSILKVLQQEEIQLYAISIGTDHMHPLLKEIAEKSGGAAFTKDNPTVEELKGIYKRIAEQIQGAEPCQISWQSDLGCGDETRLRNLEVRYAPLGIKVNEKYTAVEQSVAELQQSAFVLAFGTPPVGNPVAKELKLKARNYDFTISQATFDPPNPYFQVTNWGGANPNEVPPITIKAGEERTITVSFTQIGSQQYRSARLLLTTSPCTIDPIAVWGGAPPEDGSPIRLFAPNGDRDLSICDTATILWGGIPDYMPVRLMYSDDNGQTWKLIKDNVKGESYVWQPGNVANECLVKVESLKDFIDWKWARREGDMQMDRALGIGADANSYSYMLGSHTGTIQIDTFELKNSPVFLVRYAPDGSVVWAQDARRGSIDIAVSRDGDSYVLGHTSITKYRPDGTQGWLVQYPIFPIDSLVDIAIDGSNNCWVGGITTIETGGPIDNYEMFVRKYNSSNGSLQIPSIARPDAKCYAIAADNNGNVVVAGYFLGKKGDLFGGVALDPGYFLAKFDKDGRQLWVKNTDDIQTMALACDKDDNIFQTGLFTSGRKFGSLPPVTSSGGEDMFVAKYRPDGTAQWVRTGGATGSTSESGVDVSTDNKGNCYVTGIFSKGTLRFRLDGVEAESKGQEDVFLAKITSGGTVEWVNSVGGPRGDSVAALAVDGIGRCYLAGSFEGNANFGTHALASSGPTGMKDAFAACIGVIPAGADISDSAFAILAPQLTVKENPLDVGAIAVGEYAAATFQQVVCNTGTLPVLILKSSITGAHKDDFQLVSNLDNVTLEPGECRNLEIAFDPSAVGSRSANLVLEAECIGAITTPLVGTGLNPCDLDYKKELVMDDTDVGVPVTTTFTGALCNTGTETIEFTIDIFGPGSGAYVLRSAAAVTLAPGECYNLEVEFTPSQPGAAEIAYVGYTSECGTQVADLLGKGVPVPPVIEGAEVYSGDIKCPGDERDTAVVIYNLGKTDLVISEIELAKRTEGFTILSRPSRIAPQQSDTVRLRFAPNSAGFKSDSLIVKSNASNEPVYSIPVSGRLYDIRMDVAPNLAFGVVAPIDFPVRRTLDIRNTGDVTIELTAASFGSPSSFVVVGGVPAMLKPGSTATIEIEFSDPGANGLYTQSLELVCEPACRQWMVEVSGNRSAAEAVLSTDELEADPHERGFRIPVYLNISDINLAKDLPFTIQVKYNDALFFVRSCSNGSIVKIDTLAAERRVVVTVEGITPSSGDVLTALIGDVLLGDTVETPVEVSIVNWEGVGGSVAQPYGKLRLINITDNSGFERLMRDRGRLLGISRVVPNPANTEAKVYVNTVEVGEHVLEVYDAGGRRIYHVSWSEVATSLEGENEVTLPTKMFPVGSYNLVLRTPTRTVEGRLVVIH